MAFALHVRARSPVAVPLPPVVQQPTVLFSFPCVASQQAAPYCCLMCRPSLIKTSADYVRIGITQAISHSDANEEILEFMRAMLGVRLGQLTLVRGESTRHKLLMVTGTSPAEVFQKLEASQAGPRSTAAGSKKRSEPA